MASVAFTFACPIEVTAGVGMLVPQSQPDKRRPEAAAAYRLAREKVDATLILPAGGGRFVDASGKQLDIGAFDVLWYHQGDAIGQTGPVYDAKSIAALKQYIAGGRGLMVSGAALAMVHTLGIEPVRPREGGPGSDRTPAMLRPLVEGHPAFRGLRYGSGNVAYVADSGHRVSAEVGSYAPSAWGLHDMHGNAAEWTRSVYRAYPYDSRDGRNDTAAVGRRVVRGGSWYDRPKRARSAYRGAYQPWQGVFDVGFRVVIE